MTDARDMMKLAAKAAGYEVKVAGDGSSAIATINGWKCIWRPRDDDGDALRLAVKLGIGVQCRKHVVVTTFDVDHPGIGIAPHRRTDDITGDKNDATRRAIFNAAVTIGEAMP